MTTLRLSFLVLSAFQLASLPLLSQESVASEDSLERMPLAGPDAHRLDPGTDTSLAVDVSKLSPDHEWRGIVGLDIYGTTCGGKGRLILEAVDFTSGDVFAASTAEADQRAPHHSWGAIFSSELPGNPAVNAFDGSPDTIWQSEHKDGREEWIGLIFDSPTRLNGLHYTPRSEYINANGVARRYRIEIRQSGGDWETVASGERTENPRTTLEVPFPHAMDAGAIRFVIETDWPRKGRGSAARIELPGVKLAPVPVMASSRAWLEIPPDIMKQRDGKSFALRVRNVSDTAVLIGAPRPRFDAVPRVPNARHLNFNARRFKLGAGLLGFDALYEQNRNVLSVLEVRPETAADGGSLRPGDVILAVRGRPLPRNFLSAGWEWFHYSHETVIGRETEAALSAGEKNLSLTVLREGVAQDIRLPLNRQAAFTSLNPVDDPEAARMLDDCLAFIVRTQGDNGSWGNGMLNTSLNALALLATGEPEHVERARKAVRWAQKRYPKPDNFGSLGFWRGAYAGILYSEWHLATGDASVLPDLEALRDWVIAGFHESHWKIPALGHDPGGLPYQRRGLVAPACHLLVFEALAMRGGMESGIWERILPYMEMSWADPAKGGHGALGYHPAQKDNRQHWSRSGLFAMAAHLRGERPDMRDAMIQSMHERHPLLRNSHAYGEPGGALGLLALNLTAPEKFAEVIREYAWWFSLAWEPGYGLRFTTPHYGAPYMGEDALITAAYALVLQAPRRTLHLTGKPQ